MSEGDPRLVRVSPCEDPEGLPTAWVVSWDSTGYGDDWMVENVYATEGAARAYVAKQPGVGIYVIEEFPVRTEPIQAPEVTL